MTIDDILSDAAVGLDFSATPETWCCVDCGFNTAPGFFNRAELEQAYLAARGAFSSKQTIDDESEVYTVRDAIWRHAGMEPNGGCLCIGCLEGRIGRRLKPKDFSRDDPFNAIPGTPRLMKRRGRPR